MSDIAQGRSLADLIGGLASDISGLFRKEVQLAKTELSEKVDSALSATRLLLAGGVLALGALGVLLAAIVSGIAAFLVGAGFDPVVANSIAALIVTVIVGGIAWMLISRGLDALKASNFTLYRTTHSLAQDAEVVKEAI